MNKTSSGTHIKLQIQPGLGSFSEWEAIAEKEDLRYEVLELSAPPALNESGRFQRCVEWYRVSRRTASLHGAFIDINPASGDTAFRELSRKRCRESCETALLIGARRVVFHSGCFPFLRGSYLDLWAGVSASFYEELAETYDLGIYIENSQDVDASPIEALMKRITDRRVGACLDLGHANYSRKPLADWFDRLGDRIGYVHLSDNRGLFDDHLPLGEGTVDWEEADRLIMASGKDLPVTLEVGGIEGVRRSLAFLRKHGYLGFAEG